MSKAGHGARALLEKGLARYGRGQIAEALEAWREALEVDPGNEEARKLVEFVEARLGPQAPTPVPPVRRGTAELEWGGQDGDPTEPMEAVGGEDEGDSRKDTDPELDRTTEEVLPAAEARAQRQRPRRQTLVSNLPEILAPSTRDARGPTPVPPRAPTGDAHQRDTAARRAIPSSVPREDSSDGITRPIGADRRTPAPGSDKSTPPAGVPVRPTATFRADTPLDMALTIARTRAAKMVDECRRKLEAGDVEGAAAAAEEAMDEGDKAPMPGIAEVIEPARQMFEQAFAAHVGPEVAVPVMAASAQALNTASFDHKTGFLLSCIDGTLPVSTLLDISGMTRFDSLRTLSRLLRRKIITFG